MRCLTLVSDISTLAPTCNITPPTYLTSGCPPWMLLYYCAGLNTILVYSGPVSQCACGSVRPSARCNWCFSLWLKVEDEIFHLHHFIPSLPSLHPPILFSYSLCHPLPPSNQGLGSYCPLLMLSNGVFFRCCQTVWLSKFVIDHNIYWFLGSDCHCTSLFHASFLLKSFLFFHTSLLLKSF